MRNIYVLRKNDDDKTFYLDLAKPQEALYSQIFAEQGTTEFYQSCYEELQDKIDVVFETLTEREVKIILYRFGFLGKYYSLQETGEKLCCSGEAICQMENRVLRKLRHPSRSRKLKNNYQRYDYLFEIDERPIDLKNVILKEIDSYILEEKDKADYLDKVLKKKKISFKIPTLYIGRDTDIAEVGFSVRTFNCLKRAGICTLNDLLKKSQEDLMRILIFGRSCVAEIDELTSRVQLGSNNLNEKEDNEKFITIKVLKNEDIIKYKIKSQTKDQLVQCIYDIILEECSEWEPIINYNISFGLLNLLLLKGILFVEDVIEEYEQIISDFANGGYETYVDELNKFMFDFKKYMYDVTHDSVKVLWLNSSIAKKIIDKKAITYYNFLEGYQAENEKISYEFKQILRKKFDSGKIVEHIVQPTNQIERYKKYLVSTSNYADYQMDNNDEILECEESVEWDLIN